MKTNLLLSLVLGSALVFSGCTRGGPQVVQVESPKVDSGASKDDKKPDINTIVDTDGAGQAAVVLDEQQLKSAYEVDTSNMTYRFEYLGKSQQGAIAFANNKATLVFKDLPSDQSGTVKLELLEANVVKLAATQENVILKKGTQSQISIKLVPVTNPNGNSSTTDLSIDVTLDDKTTPDSTITPDTLGPQPNPGQLDPGQPDLVDPIAGWNGREHRGNSRWSIISVD